MKWQVILAGAIFLMILTDFLFTVTNYLGSFPCVGDNPSGMFLSSTRGGGGGGGKCCD